MHSNPSPNIPAVDHLQKTSLDTIGQPHITIAFSADPHWGSAKANEVARNAILRNAEADTLAGQLDAFFILGDIVQLGFMKSHWQKAVYDLATLAPHVPFRTIPGNHDLFLGGKKNYLRYFKTGAIAREIYHDESLLHNFRIDTDRLQIFGLELVSDSQTYNAAHYQWLEEQLQGIPDNEFVIVVTHAFIYASGYTEQFTRTAWHDSALLIAELAPLLETRVDLVISGHNHYMEWLKPFDTVYAVIGAMGGKPDPEPDYYSPASIWFSRNHFGRLDVELHDEGLHCIFKDENGRILFEDWIY